jgi:hypothetical protein
MVGSIIFSASELVAVEIMATAIHLGKEQVFDIGKCVVYMIENYKLIAQSHVLVKYNPLHLVWFSVRYGLL